MSINNENKNVTPFFTLKNKNGEDVYSIDKLSENALLISTIKPTLNSFDVLTIHDEDGKICEINIGREFINTIAYEMQRKMYDEEENEARRKQIEFLFKANNNIVCRDVDECLPNITVKQGAYQPPNGEQILNSLEKYKTEV